MQLIQNNQPKSSITLIIRVYNSYFTTGRDRIINKLLTQKNPNSRFSIYLSRTKKFYDENNGRIPIGFLFLVDEYLKRENRGYYLDWKRSPTGDSYNNIPTLRDQQKRATEQFHGHFFHGHFLPVSVWSCATGSGKSYMISNMVYRYWKNRCLVIVPDLKTFDEMWERLHIDYSQNQEFTDPDKYYRLGRFDSKYRIHGQVTLATIPSIMASRNSLIKGVKGTKAFKEQVFKDRYKPWLKQWEGYKSIFVDELDAKASPKFWGFLMDLNSASVRAGFSATPFITNDPIRKWNIAALFGDKVTAFIPIWEQWKAGILQVPEIIIYKVGKPFKPPKEWYQEADQNAEKLKAVFDRNRELFSLRLAEKDPKKTIEITEELSKNARILGQLNIKHAEHLETLKKRSNSGAYEALMKCEEKLRCILYESLLNGCKNTLIAVHRQEHGSDLKERLEEKGISNVEVINGDLKEALRDGYYANFVEQKTILVSGKTTERGANLPNIRTVIYARGYQYPQQWMGRGVRADGVHNSFRWIDFNERYSDNTKAATNSRKTYYKELKDNYPSLKIIERLPPTWEEINKLKTDLGLH